MSETNTAIQEIFEAIARLKVMVVGDVMVDKYIFGHTNRLSPEAPVPVVDVYRRENRLGGAANVALNLQALGATPLLVSVVGDDEDGYLFKELLQTHAINSSYVQLDQDRKTTVKTRVVSRHQQLLRLDSEDVNPLASEPELLVIDTIIDLIYTHSPHVVILQDYNKGVLTPSIIHNIIHNCRQSGIPVCVDPKRDNFFAYKGCTLFKPNLREALEGTGIQLQTADTESLAEVAEAIRAELENELTIITLSDKGMYVSTADSDDELIPAYYRRITDVSGAGDTVIAVLSLGLALGLDVFATVELANIAAGLVCEQVGVVPVDKEALMREAEKYLS